MEAVTVARFNRHFYSNLEIISDSITENGKLSFIPDTKVKDSRLESDENIVVLLVCIEAQQGNIDSQSITGLMGFEISGSGRNFLNINQNNFTM